MKNSRLFVALLVMFVAANCFAQDSYRQTVKEIIAPNLQDYMTQYESFLKTDITFWFKSGGDVDLKQLTERYMQERMLDNVTDLVLPKIKEIGVSEADIKATMSLLATPEGKAYREHNQQWTEATKAEFISIMTRDSLKIKNGDTSDPIQPKAEIDAGYIEKYKTAMDANVDKMISKFFAGYSNLFTAILGQWPDGHEKFVQEQKQEMQQTLENLKAWMTANVPAILMNSAYGIMTPEDLDFATKLNAQDTHKLMDLFPRSGDDLMSFSSDMLIDYVEWMKDHGAVLEYDGVLDMLKQKRGN